MWVWEYEVWGVGMRYGVWLWEYEVWEYEVWGVGMGV